MTLRPLPAISMSRSRTRVSCSIVRGEPEMMISSPRTTTFSSKCSSMSRRFRSSTPRSLIGSMPAIETIRFLKSRFTMPPKRRTLGFPPTEAKSS